MKKVLFLIGFALTLHSISACAQPLSQKKSFTRQDTLRGSVTPERAWWDATSYTISVIPDYNSRSISGSNLVQFKVLQPGQTMQIDLQAPMQLSKALFQGKELPLKQDGNVYYLQFPQQLTRGGQHAVVLEYKGVPRSAVNPPWDGGWIWKKDAKGRPWMSVAVQGLGASAWYPCKDYQGDEPDSAFMNITVPDSLVAVANGRLLGKTSNNGTTTWRWGVSNPINNYNLVPYIGKYVNWKDTYKGEKGNLDCSYWVLDYNEEKARKQFVQAHQTLQALEHWFGPYPFYEDNYKLVESPHLGMEHQSAVAYGNRFGNGYLGRDLSGSGWGLKWDYIIVHESGHEWFGNNITTKDVADMWVQEGFTDYSETLFTEFFHGKKAGSEYVQGLRASIQNDMPIIGPYGVNQEGSGDMYYKGANLIHTIRQVINDDKLFRDILRGLNKDFYHKTVTTQQVEQYISQKSKIDFSKVFDQYLRTTQIPVLEFRPDKGGFECRWTNCVEGFNMPVKTTTGKWIKPGTEWTRLKLDPEQVISIDPNFYIKANPSGNFFKQKQVSGRL
ncbi:Peptidase family M1 [Cnuella takakiae]|uniref:Peptidase family M1 n=1 Tax=Cnuella takakiae TaxID=1302690 RepID=A0A1M5GI02_9BACT|nr:M1 family metallopeptidase [Cnuella takakiae]OLY94792.1 peptidase M1 [Cnuella takakiae]SHG03141.1 Peptidase family M1 [Cnuella takakiae]